MYFTFQKTKYTAIVSTKSLYFVAVVPPATICSEITELKWQAKALFNSSQSLKSPPHITLHMPFKWEEAKEDVIKRSIQEVANHYYCFSLKIEGIGGFDPKVIFLEVQPHAPQFELFKALSLVFRKLQIFNATYKDFAFYPHITLAFRDLKKVLYPQALAHFKNISYSQEFTVENICLLKHDGSAWRIHDAFPLLIPG